MMPPWLSSNQFIAIGALLNPSGRLVGISVEITMTFWRLSEKHVERGLR
jgi:hypothetical protein